MLIGQYEAKFSEKHQVSFPKKYREVLGDKIIITKGLEKCLIIVSQDKWGTLLEGTEGQPFTNRQAREMQRFLLGNAAYIELDEKGRFVLPEHLANYAKLTDEVIFAGIVKFVELWDKKEWEEEQEKLSDNIESIASRLNNYDENLS